MKGLVIKSTGSWYEIYLADEDKTYYARLAGKLKLNKSQLTNPIAVGDYVIIEPENNINAIIHSVENRKNYIVRQSPKNRHQMHLIAANIDLAVLVTTLKEPMFKQGFIDRFIITTEPQNIPLLIVFNKSDLYEKAEMYEFEKIKEIYEAIGYQVHMVSCNNNQGIEELLDLMKSKVNLLSGQSGVGKSSIINIISPGANKKTSEISDHSGKGTHTTTFAEMTNIDKNTYIIDTPGIKTLTFNNLEILDVAHNFKEFFILSQHCRFGSNCTHRDEPECAVRTSSEKGLITFYRYQSYLSLLEEIESQNHWERNKEL